AAIVHAGPGDAARAIERNWIKLSPSCLGTHAPIETAELACEHGFRPAVDELAVLVHPLARQAAHLDLVDDGLSAKFSIPYCVAHTFMHGPPRVGDFGAIDRAVRESSRRVTVLSDESLPEFGAVLIIGEHELARV